MSRNKEELDLLAKKVVNACFEVHKNMGPGLLETVYEQCLMREFFIIGIEAENQVEIPLIYKNYEVSRNLRLDILVEKEIIMEIKSVDNLIPVHEAQIISYLKLTDKRLGFLINFNTPVIKNGLKRFANNLY